MRRAKKLLKFILLAALILSVLCVPAFALDESEVEAAVAASSKEAVTGNVLIWFLCAVAFLKVSQKIDSFIASLGINVGHTGGSLLGDAMVTFRAVTMATGGAGRILGGGRHGTGASAAGGASGSGSSSAGSAGFFKGGLIGIAGRHITNSAVKTATTQTPAVHTAQKQGAAAVHTASEKLSSSDARTDSSFHSGGVIHTDTISRTDSTAQKDSATQREGIILTGNDTPPAAPIQTGGGSPPAGSPASVGPAPVDSSVSSGVSPQENGIILTGTDIPLGPLSLRTQLSQRTISQLQISESSSHRLLHRKKLSLPAVGISFTAPARRPIWRWSGKAAGAAAQVKVILLITPVAWRTFIGAAIACSLSVCRPWAEKSSPIHFNPAVSLPMM